TVCSRLLMPTLRHLGFVFMIGVLGLFVLIPSPAAAGDATLSLDDLVQVDGTIDFKSAPNGTVNLRGWNIQLDPQRGPVLSRGNAAPTANETWAALSNNGLSSRVFALAIFQNSLYVGGTFSETEDGFIANLSNIARFDGSWHALPGDGLDDEVYAFA